MTDTARVAKLLGGPKVLGHQVRTAMDFVPLVRDGLPVAALEAVTRELELTVDPTADLLGLARRTIARRKQTDTPLDSLQSERVLRAATALAHAADVLGSTEKARRWMLEENRGLGGAKPLSLLDTDIGAAAVNDALARIEYGVFG